MKKTMFNHNETAMFDSVTDSCENIENDLLAAYASYLRNMKDLRMWEYADDMDALIKIRADHKSALASVRFSISECDRRAKDAEEIYSKIIGINSLDFVMFGVHITEKAKNIAKRRIFATLSKVNTISTRMLLKEHEIKNDLSEIEARIKAMEAMNRNK